jgi:hypothetical protein
MRVETFRALVEEVTTGETKSTGKPYRRIVLKVPAPIDQFTGQKRGKDQHYEAFAFSPNVESMIIPNHGDKVEVSGYLNGMMHLSQTDSKIFYQTTLSITDLKKL